MNPDALRGCSNILLGIVIGLLMVTAAVIPVIIFTFPDTTTYTCLEDEAKVTVGDEQWCVALDDLRKGEQHP